MKYPIKFQSGFLHFDKKSGVFFLPFMSRGQIDFVKLKTARQIMLQDILFALRNETHGLLS